MKWNILFPVLAAVGAIGIAWALAGCKTAASRASVETELPASCTLLAMSPAERAAHQQRLEALRKASLLLRETSEGFVFTVDLQRMAVADLRSWMANEQKCCSFLQMTSRMVESNAVSEVTVTCPSEMRTEVMRTFGLSAGERQ